MVPYSVIEGPGLMLGMLLALLSAKVKSVMVNVSGLVWVLRIVKLILARRLPWMEDDSVGAMLTGGLPSNVKRTVMFWCVASTSFMAE